MILVDPAQLDLFLLDDAIWLVSSHIGVPNYDFAFASFLPCRRPWARPECLTAIGRFGVCDNYAELFATLASDGIQLIHTPEQHLLASELTHWYSRIAPLTPRSAWFTQPPRVEEIEQLFAWPIFIKGSRQTSRHQASLSILRSADEYQRVVGHYQRDPILRWQPLVCREFIPLRPVEAAPSEVIPPSFEFRTFWWRGQCVGAGPYWSALAAYTWMRAEAQAALSVAAQAAQRIDVPFLVVDVAQTLAGDWIVIECNDGQESGYAGISPFALWQNIVTLSRSNDTCDHTSLILESI